jgi:GT2 family glycosyltransferase
MYFEKIYIGINYKTPEKVIRWMNSIIRNDFNQLIIIVDNSGSENIGLPKKIRQIGYKNAIYLDTGKNLGYFNGAEYAYKYIKSFKFTFAWMIVSNVDVELNSMLSSEILRKYENDSNIGVLAPAIISVDTGLDKNPYRIYRAVKRNLIIKKFVFSNILLASIYGILSKIRNLILNISRQRQVLVKEGDAIYLPYGACLIFSNKYFKSECKIDYPLFLFGEELYVAEQCREKNLKIIYSPGIKFLNYEHASTAQLSNKFVVECNYRSMSFILKTFYQ